MDGGRIKMVKDVIGDVRKFDDGDECYYFIDVIYDEENNKQHRMKHRSKKFLSTIHYGYNFKKIYVGEGKDYETEYLYYR